MPQRRTRACTRRPPFGRNDVKYRMPGDPWERVIRTYPDGSKLIERHSFDSDWSETIEHIYTICFPFEMKSSGALDTRPASLESAGGANSEQASHEG